MGVRNGEGNYPPKAAGHTNTICDEILFGSHLAKKRLENQALFNISRQAVVDSSFPVRVLQVNISLYHMYFLPLTVVSGTAETL